MLLLRKYKRKATKKMKQPILRMKEENQSSQTPGSRNRLRMHIHTKSRIHLVLLHPKLREHPNLQPIKSQKHLQSYPNTDIRPNSNKETQQASESTRTLISWTSQWPTITIQWDKLVSKTPTKCSIYTIFLTRLLFESNARRCLNQILTQPRSPTQGMISGEFHIESLLSAKIVFSRWKETLKWLNNSKYRSGRSLKRRSLIFMITGSSMLQSWMALSIPIIVL